MSAGRDPRRHLRSGPLRAPALRATRCARALGLAEVRLVPAGDPPHRGGAAAPRRASARDAARSACAEFPGPRRRRARDRARRARATRCSRSRSCAARIRGAPLLLLRRRRRVPRPADLAPLARALRARARRRRRAPGRAACRRPAAARSPPSGTRALTTDRDLLVFDARRRHLRAADRAAADLGDARSARARARRRRASTRGPRFAPAGRFGLY